LEEKLTFGAVSKGQAKLIALFLILILVPASVIVAENTTDSSVTGMTVTINENETVPHAVANDTTLPPAEPSEDVAMLNEPETAAGSDAVAGNLTGTTEEEPEQADVTDEMPSEDITDDNATIHENITGQEQLPENVTGDSFQQPDSAESAPAAQQQTEAESASNTTNETQPEKAESEPAAQQPAEEPKQDTQHEGAPEQNDDNAGEAKPLLKMALDYPQSVARGESFTVTATIENIGGGNASVVVIEWQLPPYLLADDGQVREVVSGLESGESMTSSIVLVPSSDALLGVSEIKARVGYE